MERMRNIAKKASWWIGLAVVVVAFAVILWQLSGGFSEVLPGEFADVPHRVERCTLLYESEELEGQPFRIYCPSTGWLPFLEGQ